MTKNKIKKISIFSLSLLLLSGCAGSFDYWKSSFYKLAPQLIGEKEVRKSFVAGCLKGVTDEISENNISGFNPSKKEILAFCNCYFDLWDYGSVNEKYAYGQCVDNLDGSGN